jgi:hypothetical protein
VLVERRGWGLKRIKIKVKKLIIMEGIKLHLLKEIDKNISKKEININDLSKILSDIRSFLEDDDTNKSNFQTLLFYCDWNAHSRIARNSRLYLLLEKINIGFVEIMFEDKVKEYIGTGKDVIAEALEINKLKFEINKFIAVFLHKYFHFDNSLTLKLFELIKLRKIVYPDDLKGVNLKRKQEVVIKAKALSKIVNEEEKFKQDTLDSNIDYSNPFFYKSIKALNVDKNVVFFELEIDSEITSCDKRIFYELEFR